MSEISKEERAELRKLADSTRLETDVAVYTIPRLLDALDAADERIAGLEAEVKHWRESALAWAPFEGAILAKLADGQLKLATATVVTVGFCRHGGDPGWQEAAWVDEGGQVIPDDSIAGWLPIADTYELDRAVQGEIARAFGELLGGLKEASRKCDNMAGRRAAGEHRHAALLSFASILHTSMGGRIPDEVP